MDNDPLKAAMLALRNSPAQVSDPPETAPAEAAAPPPGFIGAGFSAGASPPLSPAKPATNRPRTGKKTAAPVKTPPGSVALVPEIVENGISIEGDMPESGIDNILAESGISEANAKSPLTLQELKFVDLYLTGEYSQTKAMIAAGYTTLHPTYLKLKAKRLLAKYESLAGEARKILRAMGVGEVHIGNKIRQLMEDSSKMVQLRATELAAKCLGMFKESEISVNQGIQIVIKGREDHTGRPAAQILREAPKVPPRAMAILK